MPGVQVTDGAGELDRVRPQPLPNGEVEVGCRGDLDHLLMASLDRAVPLVEVDDVAGTVGEHLYLDMARPLDRRLQENGRVAKGGCGFSRRRLDRSPKVIWSCHSPEAAASTAGRRLYE